MARWRSSRGRWGRRCRFKYRYTSRSLQSLIGIGSWLISRRLRHDWIGALVGTVPFLVTLYFFFQNVNRLLPPNL